MLISLSSSPPPQWSEPYLRQLRLLAEETPESLVQRLTVWAPGMLAEVRSLSTQIGYALSTPVETRHGTQSVSTALGYAGAMWAICCRPHWIARLTTEWKTVSNRPVRYMCAAGLTAHYLNPPVKHWDVRHVKHHTARLLNAVNNAIRS